MSLPTESRSVVVSQKVYARLLSVYPQGHLREYGPPMAQLFRDQSRDAWAEARGWGLFMLWLRVIPDLVRTSFLEHISALKGKKNMTERISALTGPGPAPWKTFVGVAAVIFLSVFGVSTLITFLLPESYASTARIKLELSPSGVTSQDGSVVDQASAEYGPYFIQTQFEVIRSEIVLSRVIESLNLNAEWGRRYGVQGKLKTAESLDLLKSQLELRPVRNTSLVEVRVYSETPDEAAKIANAIAEAYRNYRMEDRRFRNLSGIENLVKQVAEQNEELHSATKVLDNLRKELGLSDADAAGSAPIPLVDADTIRKFEAMRMEGEIQLATQQKQLDQLSGLTKPQLREVLPSISPVSMLQELFSQLNLAELSLDKLRRDYHSAHPSVVSAEGQIKLLNQKIDDQIAGIMVAMTNQMAATTAKLARMSETLAESRAKELERANRIQTYYDRKREVENLRQFNSALSLKLASARVEASLPSLNLVQIVDRGLPSLRPARPNKPLNLACGLAGALLLAALLGGTAALIASRRQKRGSSQPVTS